MILSMIAFLLFAFGALAGWRAMLFPVYVLSPVLLATFVFLPWLTVVVLILSVLAGYLAGGRAFNMGTMVSTTSAPTTTLTRSKCSA